LAQEDLMDHIVQLNLQKIVFGLVEAERVESIIIGAKKNIITSSKRYLEVKLLLKLFSTLWLYKRLNSL